MRLSKTKIWSRSKTLLCILIVLLYTYDSDDIYKDSAEDIETRFDTSNYELDRPLSIGKNKKVIGLMKDELDGKVMKKPRAKSHSYLVDDGSEDKKAKSTKKRFIKRKLNFENDKNCLAAPKLKIKIKYQQKNKINIDSLKEMVMNS